jgi:hypothetical protein
MKNVKKISTRFIGMLAVGWFAITVTGCLDDSDPVNIPTAYVALYHGSPNAPDLNVKADGRQVNTNPFKYSDYIRYLPFFTGERDLTFGPYNASTIQIDTTVTFAPNKFYSVFVSGDYANAGIVVLKDSSSQAAAGKSKIRVVHLSPDAPEINIMATGVAEAIATNLEFEEASEFLEITAQQYDFEVKAGDDVLLTVPDITLQAGYFYTLIIRGYVEPPGENTSVLAAQVVLN